MRYSTKLPYPFVAGGDELKKLFDLLRNHMGNVTISADCADDKSRPFETIKELLTYENPKGKEIRRIVFTAQSDDYSKHGKIDLCSTPRPGILIDYTGREDVVTRLETQTLDIIAGIRPWYGVMHRINFQYVFWIVYVIFLLVLLTVAHYNWAYVSSLKYVVPGPFELWFFLLPGIFFGLGLALDRFRDSLFPRAVFRIGQGESRFKHLERVQWGILIAFLASLAASVVVAAMT